MATPYSLLTFDEVTSTQDLARGRYEGHPLLVIADQQSRGRGRSGRNWQTAPRALAASVAQQLDWPAERLPLVPLVAGLAAREVLNGEVLLKWPNDLLVRGRKVGGTLVENSGDLVVVGWGLNLWWPDPPLGVDALFSEDPGPGAAQPLAEEMASAFLRRLGDGPDRWGHDEYRSVCVTLGREITWDPDGTGKAIDVAPDGSLVVNTPEGQRHLKSGEVTHVRSDDR